MPDPTTLPAFTPVPRARPRSNGWKPEIQRAFIEKLADTGSVRHAARAVGRSPESAYQLRRHAEAEEFRAAWDAALDHGIRRIEDTAMDRALNGVDVPVYSYGKLVGKRTVYNDRLLMFMLRNRSPDRFCEGGARSLNAIDRKRLDKLKAQWREEWEEENEQEDEEASIASLDRFLHDMRQRRQANMSPEQRRLTIAAHAQPLADAAAGWRPGEPYGPYAERAAELLPQFIPEIEAQWPPLPAGAWHASEEDPQDADWHPLPAAPAEEQAEQDEPEAPTGPRIRTLKDEGWG